MSALPKVGDRIPVDRFWVSKMNMRADEPFGESEEDRALIGHVTRTRVVQPFIARPERRDGQEGYGVVVGRRRFLAMREAGFKEFVVGEHCWIREMSDDEALEDSLKENFELFRRAPDPITRAEAISTLMARMTTGGGVRRLARAWNMDHSTLIGYLRVLRLNDMMREVVRKGLVGFYDAEQLARLKLGSEMQDKMAELAEKEGVIAFRRELARLMKGRGKRGIPRGVYKVDRVVWDKRNRDEMRVREIVERAAEAKGMTEAEYIKDYIRRHIDDIAKETG